MKLSTANLSAPAAKFVLLALSSSAAIADVAVLDNTNNAQASLQTSLGSITTSRLNAKVFTTPAEEWTLESITMGLYDTQGGATYDVYVNLFAVDGSNNPTGTALASQTFSQAVSSTSTYYPFTFAGADWDLAADTTYALVVNSSATSSTLSWTITDPDDTVYTASEGFTFVANRRSIDSGSTWSDNGYYNSMLLTASTASQVSAIPEPSSVLGLGFFLAGTLLVRRRV